MQKILILSDSHGLSEQMQIIKIRHKCDHYIHCGDSELSIDHDALYGFQAVKGNCDWNAPFPNELIFNIGEVRFYVTHGHLYSVKNSLMNIQYRAQEVGAHIACFGHSHIAYAEKIDGTLFLNPGSIRLPKYFTEPSYVIATITEPQQVSVQFFNMEGTEITTFPYEKTFKLK